MLISAVLVRKTHTVCYMATLEVNTKGSSIGKKKLLANTEGDQSSDMEVDCSKAEILFVVRWADYCAMSCGETWPTHSIVLLVCSILVLITQYCNSMNFRKVGYNRCCSHYKYSSFWFALLAEAKLVRDKFSERQGTAQNRCCSW